MLTKLHYSLELLKQWQQYFKGLIEDSGDAGFVDTTWYKLPDDTFHLGFSGHFSDPSYQKEAENACQLYMYHMRQWEPEDEGTPVHDMPVYTKAKVDKDAELMWLKEDTEWGEDPCDDDDDEDGWDTVYDSAADGWQRPGLDVTNHADKVIRYNDDYIEAMRHRGVDKGMAKPIDTEDDVVNHPSHYTQGKFEVIDYIEDKLSDEEFFGYCIGNTIKYISRCKHKGNTIQDLEKADWYLDRIIGKLKDSYNKLASH